MIFENKRMALHGVGDTYILLNNNNYLIIIKDAFFNVEHRPIRDYLNNSENFSILNFIFLCTFIWAPYQKIDSKAQGLHRDCPPGWEITILSNVNSLAGGVSFLLVYENRTSKMIFLVSRNLFAWILISKIGVKINLKIITKNHAADPEIGFLTKSISKPYGRATAMPPALELTI